MSFFINIGLQKGNAQNELKKEVKVIKPYEPTISDAFKINYLPKIIDTTSIIPSFNYSIKTHVPVSDFNIDPIKPAKMVGEPLAKLYRSELKVGFGNYFNKLASASISSLRSKAWSYGANFSHFSSDGKVNNRNSNKVYNGFAYNNIDLFTKRYINNKLINGNIHYGHHKNYFYGYNTNNSYADLPLKKDDIEQQKVNFFDIKAGIASNYLDSANVNYDIDIEYKYLKDDFLVQENYVGVKADVNYFVDNRIMGFDSKITYLNADHTINTINYAIIKFNPWIAAYGEKWRITAGVNTYFEQSKSNYYIFPRLSLHYNIIDYFLVPYMELGCKLKEHSYAETILENPYLNPGQTIKPTYYKMDVILGFRGNISSRIGFNVGFSYKDVKDMYFYVNDTIDLLENKFTVIYDNGNIMNLHGELSYKKSEKFNAILKAAFYKYELDKEKYASHKPDYEITLSGRYLLQEKFIVTTDIFALSKRYAKNIDAISTQNEYVELEGIIDINLGVEYRYTKVLSAFLKLNNLGAVKYDFYNQYPSQGFNFMFGLVYSL